MFIFIYFDKGSIGISGFVIVCFDVSICEMGILGLRIFVGLCRNYDDGVYE